MRFLIALLIASLLLGCSQQHIAPINAAPSSAPVGECPGEYINQTVELATGLRWAEYTVEKSACNPGRGGYLNVNLNVTQSPGGAAVTITKKAGFCNPDGTDCGWELCVASKDANVIDAAKRIACTTLSSFSVKNASCAGPARDDSVALRDQCLGGKFTDGTTFSLRQVIASCGASVENGPSC